MKLKLLAQGVDVAAINDQLGSQPELWNANGYRTAQKTSPHRDINDIWLRWRSPAQLIDNASYEEEHFSVDWPAWHALPALHGIVRHLSSVVDARMRGGILLTETPGGKAVKPHIDHGWHAEFYDTKLYLILQSDPRCLIHCDGEVANPREGDVWTYPNNVLHSVENAGTIPHRNVIICFRTL